MQQILAGSLAQCSPTKLALAREYPRCTYLLTCLLASGLVYQQEITVTRQIQDAHTPGCGPHHIVNTKVTADVSPSKAIEHNISAHATPNTALIVAIM